MVTVVFLSVHAEDDNDQKDNDPVVAVVLNSTELHAALGHTVAGEGPISPPAQGIFILLYYVPETMICFPLYRGN